MPELIITPVKERLLLLNDNDFKIIQSNIHYWNGFGIERRN